MKRAVVSLVAGALAAGSVVAAGPALAGPGDPVGCIPPAPSPGTPAQSIVRMDGFDVTINPGGSVNPGGVWRFGADVEVALWGYAGCVEGDVADPATCLIWEAGAGNYVTIDQSITVHGNELVADANACI